MARHVATRSTWVLLAPPACTGGESPPFERAREQRRCRHASAGGARFPYLERFRVDSNRFREYQRAAERPAVLGALQMVDGHGGIGHVGMSRLGRVSR